MVRILLLFVLMSTALLSQSRQLQFAPPDGVVQIAEEAGQQVWLSRNGDRRVVDVAEKKRFAYYRDGGDFVMEITALESSIFADGRRRRDPMMEARLGIPMRYRADTQGRSIGIVDYEETTERILAGVPPEFQQGYRSAMSKQRALATANASWEILVGTLIGRDLWPGLSLRARARVPDTPSPERLYILHRVLWEEECAPGVRCLRIRTDASSEEADVDTVANLVVPRGNLGEFAALPVARNGKAVNRFLCERLLDPDTGLIYEQVIYRGASFDPDLLPPSQQVVAMESLRVSTRQIVAKH